jgi:FkbM family methyltransferase
MTFRNLIARTVQKAMNARGYSISRLSDNHLTMESAIEGIAARKHVFNSVIDIGASNGSWSELMMRRFPSCEYLLIEAQPVHEQSLIKFCSLHPNARFSLLAAGESSGTINFDASQAFAGQASAEPYAENNIVVPVSSLDDEVQKHHLSGPFLVKLDTHGFEVPILKGAKTVLEQTEAVVMECYNFRIARECLLFYEMCSYIEKLGFRCIDLVAPLHRPLDNAFWQMDLIFVRDSRPEFSVLRYS